MKPQKSAQQNWDAVAQSVVVDGCQPKSQIRLGWQRHIVNICNFE
jgi:hypothetical protein